MKIVFVDNEYTGLHASTTLVSVGLATLEGNSLYVTFDDYDLTQVTPWLKRNVLSLIDDRGRVSAERGFRQISRFLEDYSQGERITLVSAGKALDLVLLFELWRFQCQHGQQFHWLECLPGYLCHRAHLDLDTLFVAAGIDPDIDRDEFVEHRVRGTRHDALYDALVVRACFVKMMREGNLPGMSASLPRVAFGEEAADAGPHRSTTGKVL